MRGVSPPILSATLLCWTLLFGACKRSQVSPPQPGDWLLKYSIGGIAGSRIDIPSSTVAILRLKNDNTFLRLWNDATTSSGEYQIRDTTYPTGQHEPVIRFMTNSGQYFMSCAMTVKGDSLTLRDFIADGYTSFYIRQP